MEDHSLCKNWKGNCHNIDTPLPKKKELLRRFEKLSQTEKQGLIDSIYRRGCCTKEATEAFETILSLFKWKNGEVIPNQAHQNDSDDYEEEEEEDEESDEENEIWDKCDKRKLVIDKRDDKILNEKLLGLFKAIYTKDPELKNISNDAFQWMTEKKITGNICPHIKRAIQECLKIKKEEINKLWIHDLTETVNGEKQLKIVKDNVEAYVKLINELISAYELYNNSIGTVVEVWKPMLNNASTLDKTFHLLIMTEFVESIWGDRNIKVVIEEIFQNKDYLVDYEKEITQMTIINEKLGVISQSIQMKTDTSSKSDSGTHSPWGEGKSCQHSGCNCWSKSK